MRGAAGPGMGSVVGEERGLIRVKPRFKQRGGGLSWAMGIVEHLCGFEKGF